MDDGHDQTAETGPWPMGWAYAALAGGMAFVLTSGIGGAGFWAALTIGAVSFGVFGVLLGAGGVERTAPPDAHHSDHHGDHHGDHH
jgi:hypothetical protein